MRALERLFEAGAAEADIDRFFDALPETDDSASILRKIFRKPDGAVRDQIPFLSDLYRNGMYVEHRPGARVAFIFYCTYLDCAGTALARSVLSRLNAHCIYLYDNQQLNFARGIPQLGPTVDDTYAAWKQHVREWGVDRVITIGSSAAGFAAIFNAVKHGTYGSVTFAPFTTFGDDFHRNDGRSWAMLNRISRSAPDFLFDLRPGIAGREPPLRLVCFYSQELPQDAWHATRLRGIPGVFPIAINSDKHGLFMLLLLNGLFAFLMQRLSNEEPIEDAVAHVRSRFSPRKPRVSDVKKRLLKAPLPLPVRKFKAREKECSSVFELLVAGGGFEPPTSGL